MPERIAKFGKEWVVLTHDQTRVLGTHHTKKAAEAQKIAISISRARRAEHRIPRLQRTKG